MGLGRSDNGETPHASARKRMFDHGEIVPPCHDDITVIAVHDSQYRASGVEPTGIANPKRWPIGFWH
jgi:hypothetical protein